MNKQIDSQVELTKKEKKIINTVIRKILFEFFYILLGIFLAFWNFSSMWYNVILSNYFYAVLNFLGGCMAAIFILLRIELWKKLLLASKKNAIKRNNILE